MRALAFKIAEFVAFEVATVAVLELDVDRLFQHIVVLGYAAAVGGSHFAAVAWHFFLHLGVVLVFI